MARTSLQKFKTLRVFKKLPLVLLLNNIICNRLMKFSSLVDKAPLIYNLSTRFIGKNFINYVLNKTYCRMFTAGNTIDQANEASTFFREQKIPVILDYCAEGDINNANLQGGLDQNAQLFAESARVISLHPNEMISIKITGLLDMRILKKWNDAIIMRDKFWNDNSKDGFLTYENLVKGLNKVNGNLNENTVKKYLKQIHNYQQEPSNFKIDEIDFKINHQPIYIYSQKSQNEIIASFIHLNQEEKIKFNNFRKRLSIICDPFSQNKTNFRILVDAEQSYIQKGIESISEQMQEQFNSNQLYIIPTIQNYLKRSLYRCEYEVNLAKRRNLIFGAKLVRGAYMVEESRLAKQLGYENPVVECFQKTTQNYMKSYELIVSSFTSGEVIVASHNQDTIYEAIKIKQKYKTSPQVSFAQLMGLADHLTWMVRNQNYTVYKYLPWAQTQVMVPYMIRRAQQLNQMRYPLDTQFQLLLHEIKSRIY